MNCPNCHSENRDGAKYCNECGFPLSGRIAEVAAAGEDVVAAMAGGSPAPAAPFGPDGAQNASSCGQGGAQAAPAQEDASSDAGSPDVGAEPPATAGEAAGGAGGRASAGQDAPCPAVPGGPEADGARGGAGPATAPAAPEGAGAGSDAPVGEASGTPSVSGPLDPARVPSIAVAGVNADEDGNLFDFSPVEDEGPDAAFPLPAGGPEPARGPAGPTAPARAAEVPADGRTADLSGIERLVDSGYVPPASAWRSGDTMEMPPVEGGTSAGRREFRAGDAPGTRRRFPKKALVALAAVLVLAAAAVAVTYQMELWGGRTVPDVVGKSQADATHELVRKGFTVRWTQVKSDDVEGKVLLTDPSAGSRKEEGTEVVIHVSAARTVPDVVGKPQPEAQALFDAEECTNVEYRPVKSDEAEGTVLAVEPGVGEKVKASTPIVVQVATPYTVPEVAGKSRADAEAAIAEAGFSCEVAWVYAEDVEEGVAVSTDPAAGTKLASGSTVVLNLAKSRSKELVNLTYSFFASAGTLSIDGATYELDPDAEGNALYVEYVGDSTCSYSVLGRVVEQVDTIFFGTQTFYGDWQVLTGTVTWGDDDTISSASPGIS